MTPKQNKQAEAFLREHVTQPCARCGSSVWSVLGLSTRSLDTIEGPRGVQCVVVGCNGCFAVSEHVAKPMGLTLT